MLSAGVRWCSWWLFVGVSTAELVLFVRCVSVAGILNVNYWRHEKVFKGTTVASADTTSMDVNDIERHNSGKHGCSKCGCK